MNNKDMGDENNAIYDVSEEELNSETGQKLIGKCLSSKQKKKVSKLRLIDPNE